VRLQLGKIAPLALGHMLGTVFTNMSLGKVAVSFTHTIKASEPFFTVLLSALFLGEVGHLNTCETSSFRSSRFPPWSQQNSVDCCSAQFACSPSRLQVPSLPVLGSLVPIVGGVALASFTEVSFNWSVLPPYRLENLGIPPSDLLPFCCWDSMIGGILTVNTVILSGDQDWVLERHGVQSDQPIKECPQQETPGR